MKTRFFSPEGLFYRMAVIISVYFILDLTGFREYTCVICGTSPTGDPNDVFGILIGIIYALLYFFSTMVFPAFAIGGGLFLLLLFCFPGSNQESACTPKK